MDITINTDKKCPNSGQEAGADKGAAITFRNNSDVAERECYVRRLDDSFKKLSRDMGLRDWSREDLYEW